MKLESNFVDVFAKYYGFEKLAKSNPYYELKKQNYEAVKETYKNKIILPNTHPIRATIQTTYCCNLNCIMCQLHSQYASQQLQSMRKNAMKKDDFDKIASELFPYLVEVHPTNVGEPLISPWFDYMCDVVQKYGVLLDITSNGMLLTEEKILHILPSLLDIKISFEGIKKETFESISKGLDYNKICENIDTFLRLRNEMHSKATITLQMTLLDINYHELLDVIRFSKEKGVDRVKAYHVFSQSKEMDEHSLLKDPESEALFEEVRTSAISLAENLGIALEISEPRAELKDCSLISQHCRLPWGEVFVDYDANVYPCHSHKKIAYGNLISQNWQEIWNSEYAQTLRRSLVTQSEETICKNCGMNFLKYDENQSVPHNRNGYLSNNIESNEILWSGRSRQFELNKKNNLMEEKEIIEQLKLIFPNAAIKTLQESGMSFAFEVNNSIIRVPKNEYAKNGYITEEKVLSYLHNIITVTQIPTIQIIETPFFYTIHKKIDGLYWNGKEYSLKSDKEKDALAYDCAKFFNELHSSDISKIDAELTGMRPIMQNMEKYLSQYFTVQEMEKANRIVEPLFSLPKEDNVLIHNDFYTDNFFVNKDYHLQGVIDFGNCAFLNYNFEFRKIVSHEEGEHDFWQRIIHYYEELSGRKIDIEIIRKIDIYNYVRFLVYFSKFPEVHETKILVRENWGHHIQHVKDKLEKI